jgi:hypothetical protein
VSNAPLYLESEKSVLTKGKKNKESRPQPLHEHLLHLLRCSEAYHFLKQIHFVAGLLLPAHSFAQAPTPKTPPPPNTKQASLLIWRTGGIKGLNFIGSKAEIKSYKIEGKALDVAEVKGSFSGQTSLNCKIAGYPNTIPVKAGKFTIKVVMLTPINTIICKTLKDSGTTQVARVKIMAENFSRQPRAFDLKVFKEYASRSKIHTYGPTDSTTDQSLRIDWRDVALARPPQGKKVYAASIKGSLANPNSEVLCHLAFDKSSKRKPLVLTGKDFHIRVALVRTHSLLTCTGEGKSARLLMEYSGKLSTSKAAAPLLSLAKDEEEKGDQTEKRPYLLAGSLGYVASNYLESYLPQISQVTLSAHLNYEHLFLSNHRLKLTFERDIVTLDKNASNGFAQTLVQASYLYRLPIHISLGSAEGDALEDTEDEAPEQKSENMARKSQIMDMRFWMGITFNAMQMTAEADSYGFDYLLYPSLASQIFLKLDADHLLILHLGLAVIPKPTFKEIRLYNRELQLALSLVKMLGGHKLRAGLEVRDIRFDQDEEAGEVESNTSRVALSVGYEY